MPVERRSQETHLLLSPDARVGPACACGVVCVCLSCKPSLPKPTPQQFAIPYKFGNRFLENSMTHNGTGWGEGSGTGAPNLRVIDCKNLGGRGGAGPHFTKVHRSALGRGSQRTRGASRAGLLGSVRTFLHRYLCLFKNYYW